MISNANVITTDLEALISNIRGSQLKIPVFDWVLAKRLNRRLKRSNLRLCTARRYRGREDSNLGRHYIVDANNTLIFNHVNIEEMARDLRVLGSEEIVVWG